MTINNLEKITATGLKDNKFVGIKLENNRIEFHYPETFDLSANDEGLRKDIISILKSVSLAKTLTSDESTYNTKSRNKYEFPLMSYLWIINDYLTYGTYINIEKHYAEGIKGKINWKRTMQSNPALSNGNVVYLKIISQQKNQTNNLLTEIYYYCVQESIEAIGWLYNLSFDSHGVDYKRLFKREKYINAIDTELSKSFDDMKKMRLSHMKNIILGLDDDIQHTKEVIFGVDSYEYVFEKMIDKMFSRVGNKKDFYPNALWDTDYPRHKDIKSTNLRPDTIAIKDKTVFILDAKYYRYGTTFNSSDLPETTSIQKQITYGEYIKKIKEDQYDDVYNAFIMPYNKHNNPYDLNGNIEFVGIGKASWKDGDASYKKIAAFLIDTKFLVQNYINRSDKTFDSLVRLIEDKVRDVNEDTTNN